MFCKADLPRQMSCCHMRLKWTHKHPIFENFSALYGEKNKTHPVLQGSLWSGYFWTLENKQPKKACALCQSIGEKKDAQTKWYPTIDLMTHPGEIVWMGGGDGVWEVNKVGHMAYRLTLGWFAILKSRWNVGLHQGTITEGTEIPVLLLAWKRAVDQCNARQKWI